MNHAYDRLFLYGLLAALFREPERDLLDLLADEEMQTLRNYLPGFPEPPLKKGDAVLEELRHGFERLSVAAPLQASAYREGEGAAMEELYRRLGLEPDPDAPAIDLLPMVLELLVLLADLEAEAEDAGREGEVERSRAWHRVVVDEHLRNWVPLWVCKARDTRPTAFYAWAIDLLERVLEKDRDLEP